jgi:sulfate transport system substrate-binding protein
LFKRKLSLATAITGALLSLAGAARADRSLLNVSYDPTRELYRAYNQAFAGYWQATHHESIRVQQSHGGSGKQARAVIDGLDADVVTLALPIDVAAIQKAGLIAPGWQGRLPNHSSPYTSTIVLVVRKGNPKHIHDWNDLARPGVQVITANPKTGGGARLNYLAAWGYALKQPGGSQATARDFVQKLYRNVPVLDSGARGSTNTFVQRHIGDVLIAWENEALEINSKIAPGQVEIVTPSISILAEPPVAVVDRNADKHHTRDLAAAYLSWLYSPQGQEVVAQHYYRPRLASVARKYAGQYPKIRLFDISLFGGWDAAQKTHFADGGTFDQIVRR